MDIKKISNLAIQPQQINRVDESKNKIVGNDGAVGTNVNLSRGLFDAAVAKTKTNDSPDKLNNISHIRDLQTMAAGQTGQIQQLTTEDIQSAIANAKKEITAATNPLEITAVISRFTAKF